MKKLLALVLALVMVFALAACGESGSTATDPPADNTDSEAEVTDNTNTEEELFYTDDIDTTGISVEGSEIVYLAPTLDIEYWQWVEEGVKMACEEYGVTYTTFVAENSAATRTERRDRCHAWAPTRSCSALFRPIPAPACSTHARMPASL